MIVLQKFPFVRMKKMLQSSRNKKRIFHLLLLFVLGWFILFYRLFVIQISDTRDFSSHHINLLDQSVNQRKQSFLLSTGRGNIYDQNLQSLLGQREIKTIVLFPFIKDRLGTNEITLIADILNMKQEELSGQLEELQIPSLLRKENQPIEINAEQEKKIEELQIDGLIPTSFTIQNEDEVLAKHVIGYLGQAPQEINEKYGEYLKRGVLQNNSYIGRSGLQISFQELLMGVGEKKIAYFVDNIGRPMNGLSYHYLDQEDSYYPLSLVTTIDKEIQNMAEKALNQYHIEDGSIVVLDVKNADILAMASSPDYNLNQVNPFSTDWNNKAVQVIEPGSIFKTVLAIAGLEEGITQLDERFYCSQELDSYHFPCDIPTEGISFMEGYAKSRNAVFAEISRRLGADTIENYANQLGFNGTVGWEGEFFKENHFKQISEEQTNRVFHPSTNRKDPGSLMRTAIGQQDVRISPLAAANLVVTILNNGRVYQPRLVNKVIYKNGMDYYQFPVHYSNDQIGSPETYQTIRKMMEEVVKEGTGQILTQAKWELAGKSGTAETANGLTHQWFIGYGPSDHPRYAVAVAVKNVKTNEPLAKKVFMEMMDALAEQDTSLDSF